VPLLCYLAQVRAVIDAVASDESLSRSDRSRIVDLLRKVEQALVDIKINGALLVQEAAAAAGVIVGLSFWERVRSRPWARHFVVVVAAPFAALEATANTRGHRAVLLGSAAERRSDPVERRRYDFTDLPVFDALRRDRRYFRGQLHPAGHTHAAQALLVPWPSCPRPQLAPPASR
jgi:hypothetical protein